MKKKLVMFFIIVTCFIIVGCDKNNNKSEINLSLDSEGNYTGFDKLKNYTSAKEAVADGCYVKDGDEFKGTKYWKGFLDEASNGKDTQLRMVILSGDSKNEYIDLFYQDELYYAIKSGTGDLSVKGYKYLLVLENNKTVDNQTAYAIVLSNDDTLTFTNIINNLTSSKDIVTDEPYKIVFLGMKSV